MFDANYFRTALARDIAATGGAPVVEVLLLSGYVHRIRAVVEVTDGRVTVEAYPMRGDLSHERPRFGAADTTLETVRAVVSYESIAAVVLDPSPAQVKARPGFASN
jgi:hypothetical protein